MGVSAGCYMPWAPLRLQRQKQGDELPTANLSQRTLYSGVLVLDEEGKSMGVTYATNPELDDRSELDNPQDVHFPYSYRKRTSSLNTAVESMLFSRRREHRYRHHKSSWRLNRLAVLLVRAIFSPRQSFVRRLELSPCANLKNRARKSLDNRDGSISHV
jgi:hypothetical protein